MLKVVRSRCVRGPVEDGEARGEQSQMVAVAVAAWMGWKVQPSCDCTSGHIELPVDCRRRRGLPRGPLGSATRIAYAALMPLSIEVEGDVDNLP